MKRKFAALMALVLLFSGIGALPVMGQEELSVSAPAGILMDGESGEVLFEKNAHEQRPCASITKVMTLLLVFEALDRGDITLTQELTASQHAASMGGSDIWLKAGESMSVDDLIKATVIMSANDAAVVLAEGVSGSETAFIEEMNRRGGQLGMADTVFKNCNGLDEEGHITSAYDVALMSRELIKHKDIANYTTIWMDYLRDGETQLVNTNKLLKSYDGITGLKTGTTSKAGSCITATAKRGDLGLIAVVLGADSTDNRFKDASALLDYGFGNWKVTVPQTPYLPEAEIKGGMKKFIQAEIPDAPSILLRTGENTEIVPNQELMENLTAPIEEGEIIGKVTYLSGETVLREDYIYAAETVEAITFKNSFMYYLNGIFSGAQR